MDLQATPLACEPAKLQGLSERLIRSHYDNNYLGALKRLNAIRAKLSEAPPASLPGFALNGLKREELIAANSVWLHELYFDCLGGSGGLPDGPLGAGLAAAFGSATQWRDEFVAMGKALGGGSGWVLLSYLPREGRLVNQWAADHAHAFAGGTPILALDMYEHSYHLDFGAKAGDYVDAFMANLDWDRVADRYQQAVYAAAQAMAVSPAWLAEHCASVDVVDVRRAPVFEQADSLIAGASWHDPAQVEQWAGDLPADREVVLYCVHGHEVCRAAAVTLQARGLSARYLDGGIAAWQAAGFALQRKE